MPSRSGPRFVAYAFSSTILAVLALAQNGAPTSNLPTIKTNVRQVLVPVIVTDKSGHYAADLDRNDFSVFEDGVPQKIVAFSRSPVSSESTELLESTPGHAPATSPSSALNASPKRTYLICLDTLHSAFTNFAQVRQALRKFFAHEQGGDSQYALVALGWKLHVVVDSTRDPAVILAAIDSKSLLKTIQDSEASNIANEVDRFQQLVGRWCGGCQCTNQTTDMANILCPTWKAQVKATVFSFSERTALLNQEFLQQLRQLVGAMSTMPTKRTVLFISDGFNRFPGQELYGILKVYGVSDPELKFNPQDLQPQLDAILKLAVRDDTRFYTLDSRGLYTYADAPGSGVDASSRGAAPAATHRAMLTAWSNGDAMAQLARETGGFFFENSNDLLRGIRRAFADGREECVLAYVPSNTRSDSQFRRITVEVKEKKLRVSAKAGYWPTP